MATPARPEGVELRTVEKPPAGTKVPKRRFGRTEIQMPILTCGGMRIQMKWGDDAAWNLGDTITEECQANFDATIEQAFEYGINHFETARGYGCSEKQFCQSLSKLCEKVDRADIIVQTKVPPKATAEEFREALQRSFDTLKPPGGYIDLFGFHGVNNEERLEWTKLCMPVAKEFQAAGKIKHIGFSTHAMTPTILNAIETDMFDYVNLHYQFIGSYTSTGSGSLGGFYCNKLAIEAARKHDMGVFIISPTDKGGHLYMPPKKMADACGELSPIEFNNLWLLCDPAIHTLVVGAARPQDFHDHVQSILKYENRGTLVPPIESKLNQMLIEAHGAEFIATWWKGIPDMWGNLNGAAPWTDMARNPKVINVLGPVWLWMIAKAWDLLGYSRIRYSEFFSNAKMWKDEATPEENLSAQNTSWCPGLPIPTTEDAKDVLTPLLADSPNAEKIMEILMEAREMFAETHDEEKFPMPPYAYDMRPDVEFPKR